jgi:hypothetical protein
VVIYIKTVKLARRKISGHPGAICPTVLPFWLLVHTKIFSTRLYFFLKLELGETPDFCI